MKPLFPYLFSVSKLCVIVSTGLWMAVWPTSFLEGATRTWTGMTIMEEGSFFDDFLWDQSLIAGEDGFQIHGGRVILEGELQQDGTYTARSFQTAGNNFIGLQNQGEIPPELVIRQGGHLKTSERVPDGNGGFTPYELFVGRNHTAGTGNRGSLVIEEGGTLSLGYHLAVGRNGGNGNVVIHGGLMESNHGGNLYLGWDGTHNMQFESYGEFLQYGGEVKLGAGYIYIATQAGANAMASRGYLEMSLDAKLEANGIFVGRQGLGSSGTLKLLNDASIKATTLVLGGEWSSSHGANGFVHMLDRSRIEVSTINVGSGRGPTRSLFQQDGGSVQANTVRVGFNGSDGKYQLDGTATLSSTFLYVGAASIQVIGGVASMEYGTGNFEMNGESVATFEQVTVGHGAQGRVHLRGGRLESATSLLLGNTFNIQHGNPSQTFSTNPGHGILEVDAGVVVADVLTVGTAIGSGEVIQRGGSITSKKTINVGFSDAHEGAYQMTGGQLTLTNNDAHWVIGRASVGKVTMAGGTVLVGGSVGIGQMNTGDGELTMSGGQITTRFGTGFYVGEVGRGKLTISGDALIVVNPNSGNGLNIGRTGSVAYGEVFMNGGTIRTNIVKRSAGQGFLYFNGGVLQAAKTEGNFIQSLTRAEVRTGGAIFDTQGFNVTVSQAFLSGGSDDGGLQKRGTGTLTLNASNTFVGKTEVRQGTLKVDHRDALAKSAWIEVKSGASLNVSALEQPANLVVDAVISGSGTLLGAVTMKSGQKIKIGDSGTGAARSRAGELIGQLKINQLLTLQGGAAVEFGIGQVQGQKGTAWDHMLLSESAEAVLIDTQRVLIAITEGSASGFDATQNYTWELMQSSTGALGLSASQLQLDMSGWQSESSLGVFTLNFADPSALRLEYQFLGAVPEPKLALLSVLGVLAVLAQRRRSPR